MAHRIWIERCALVLLPAAALSFSCGAEDDGADEPSNCPGAGTVCPSACQPHELPALTAAGCLEPQIASCRQPKPPYANDAGCAKRDADGRLFRVTHGGWPSVEGFEECTADEQGKVMAALGCS